jgi:tRNA pseudouridine38-40 synthase
LETGKTRRLRATIAYDGTDFHGWQVQPGLPTIQGELQAVLTEIEGGPVHVFGSGRTDAGVHALAQVSAFDLSSPIPNGNLLRAMNRLLPEAIRVLAVENAEPGFHPRHHARRKTYEYRIHRGAICSPFERRWVHHYPYPLDERAIASVTDLLVGTHDFSAFAASDDKNERGASKIRSIFSSVWESAAERAVYRVSGSGFLKHMVRNIAGTLIEVGKGNLTADDLRAFLQPGYPGKAGPRAPACGLFLVCVEY